MLWTDDLFLGGFALVRGGELDGVEVRGVNGRRMAVFRIVGPDLEEVERDFYRGSAVVNLQLLKAQVRRLKDVAFQAMREERPRGTDIGAASAVRREEGRGDEGHERRDRRDQAPERPGRSRHRAWD